MHRESSFCIRFQQKLDALCTERKFGGEVVWCYGEKSAVPTRQQLPANISFNEGVPEDFDNAHGETCLGILDDLLNDVYSNQVCDFFTKGSHHRNTCVILITQNLFHQGMFCRDISLNVNYIAALKNVSDKKLFVYLANEVYPEHSISLYNADLDVIQEPHGYILLDLTQDKTKGQSFGTNIFPTDIHPLAVYSDIGDEACEINYHTLQVL